MKISKLKKNCVNFAAVHLKVFMRTSEYTQNERETSTKNMKLYKNEWPTWMCINVLFDEGIILNL
jgi:hypothetical protein